MAFRVAYISHYGALYGANRSLLDLLKEFKGSGHVAPLVILAEAGPMKDELDRLDIENEVVPFEPWMHKRVYMGGLHHKLMQWFRYGKAAHARTQRNKRSVDRILSVCKARNIQVVHSNSSVIGIGGTLAQELTVPFVWHIRELPFDHYAFSVDGGIARYRNALQKANAIIAISKAVSEDVAARIGNKANIHVVPNGFITPQSIKHAEENANERWGSPVPFRFLQLGLFHPSKGQLEAVDAFARMHAGMPATRLVLAGGGRQDTVRERIKDAHLENAVELPGFVESPQRELERAHCLLQCSKHEAMGRVTIEAMASGIPVIGHASGATPELVDHGRTGLLYTTGQELEQHMRTLASDPDRARRMGEAARTTIPKEYNTLVMAGHIRSIYASLGVPS